MSKKDVFKFKRGSKEGTIRNNLGLSQEAPFNLDSKLLVVRWWSVVWCGVVWCGVVLCGVV